MVTKIPGKIVKSTWKYQGNIREFCRRGKVGTLVNFSTVDLSYCAMLRFNSVSIHFRKLRTVSFSMKKFIVEKLIS